MNIKVVIKYSFALLFLIFSSILVAGEKEDNFIAGKTVDCEDCILVGLKLKHMDLRGANLQNADLRTTSFHRSDLFEANFDNANLEGANLNKTILIDTKSDYFHCIKTSEHEPGRCVTFSSSGWQCTEILPSSHSIQVGQQNMWRKKQNHEKGSESKRKK